MDDPERTLEMTEWHSYRSAARALSSELHLRCSSRLIESRRVMRDRTTKIGAWAGVVLLSTGFGMLLKAIGHRHRHQTPQQWANEAGVDLWMWLSLAGVFLAGGVVLIVILRWPARK